MLVNRKTAALCRHMLLPVNRFVLSKINKQKTIFDYVCMQYQQWPEGAPGLLELELKSVVRCYVGTGELGPLQEQLVL